MFSGQDNDPHQLVWDDEKDKVENIRLNAARCLAFAKLSDEQRAIVDNLLARIRQISDLLTETNRIARAKKFLQPQDPEIMDKRVEIGVARSDLFDYMQSDEVKEALGQTPSLLSALIEKSKEQLDPKKIAMQQMMPEPPESLPKTRNTIVISLKKDKEQIIQDKKKTPIQNIKMNLERYLNEYSKKRYVDPKHLRAAEKIAQNIRALEKIQKTNSLAYLLALKELLDTMQSAQLRSGGLLGKSYLYALVQYAQPLLKGELSEIQRVMEEALKERVGLTAQLSAANLKSAGLSALHENTKSELAELKKQVAVMEAVLAKSANQMASLTEELSQEKLKSTWLRHAYNHLIDALNALSNRFGHGAVIEKIEKSHGKEEIENRVKSAVKATDGIKKEPPAPSSTKRGLFG